MSVLKQKLNLIGQPAGTYTGYLEVDGSIGSLGPDGFGLVGFAPIAYDAQGNLKAAGGVTDYVVAPAVPGALGHAAAVNLTMFWNGQIRGAIRFELTETSAGFIDVGVLYAQGKAQPASPEQLTSLTDLLGQAGTLVPQMTQSLADTAHLLAQLNALPIGIRGLRVGNGASGDYGGGLWDFTPDSSVTLSATYTTGSYGGLLYDLTGGQ